MYKLIESKKHPLRSSGIAIFMRLSGADIQGTVVLVLIPIDLWRTFHEKTIYDRSTVVIDAHEFIRRDKPEGGGHLH